MAAVHAEVRRDPAGPGRRACSARSARSSASYGTWFDADHRIQRHDLAGGPLLDLGTYPLSLTGWVLGAPTEVVARGTEAPSGVNGQVSALLGYASGARAVVHTSILASTPVELVIAGSEATLTIADGFSLPGPFTVGAHGRRTPRLHRAPDRVRRARLPGGRRRPAHQPRASSRRPIRPLQESVATMALIDEIRRQIGVVWDEER